MLSAFISGVGKIGVLGRLNIAYKLCTKLACRPCASGVVGPTFFLSHRTDRFRQS